MATVGVKGLSKYNVYSNVIHRMNYSYGR